MFKMDAGRRNGERQLRVETSAERHRQDSEGHGPIPVAGEWITVRRSRRCLPGHKHPLRPEPQGCGIKGDKQHFPVRCRQRLVPLSLGPVGPGGSRADQSPL